MSICKDHGNIVRFLCVTKDCKANSTAICDTCLKTTHNHGTNMNINVDQLNHIF